MMPPPRQPQASVRHGVSKGHRDALALGARVLLCLRYKLLGIGLAANGTCTLAPSKMNDRPNHFLTPFLGVLVEGGRPLR